VLVSQAAILDKFCSGKFLDDVDIAILHVLYDIVWLEVGVKLPTW